jgi:hypothetical protein
VPLLACPHRAAHVDIDHAIHLFERGLLEGFRNCCAGVVHKHIELAEGCDGLFDRTELWYRGDGVGPPEISLPLREASKMRVRVRSASESENLPYHPPGEFGQDGRWRTLV